MAKHKRNHNKVSRNSAVNMPATNRNYKDTIFRMLFSDRKNLLSLYNAVNQRKYLHQILLSFIMVRRQLPDCTELRLSSAFEHLSGEPKLELIVTVLNVNEGHNADLMQHCNTLNEYAQYVARVRLYAADMSLDQAVERAVDECIREGILAEFLTCNRNEVISMSIFEYDKELEEKKLRKAEYEAGHEAGFSEGEKYGIERGTFLNSIETARRMLKFQEFSLEKIAAISGLSLDEIKKLQTNEARSDS